MSKMYQNQMGSKKYNYSITSRIGNQDLQSTLGTKDIDVATKLKIKIDELEIDARLNPHRTENYIHSFWTLLGKDDQYRKQQEDLNPDFLTLYEKMYMSKYRDEVISDRTLTLYKDFHKNMDSLLNQHNLEGLKLNGFNLKVLDHLMEFFAAQEYSATTKNMRLRLLKCFFNWCLSRKVIKEVPFIIPKVKEPHKKPSFIYPDQFKAILDATPNPVIRSYFKIYRATGLRRSEIFNYKEINRSNGTWLMVKGKGNKERVVHIPDDMIDHWNIVKDNVYLPHSLTRAMQRASEIVGIKVRLHDLRHTFAFTQVASGIDPFTLQMKMGHSDFKTTQVYLQTDRKMLMDLISDNNKLLDESSALA